MSVATVEARIATILGRFSAPQTRAVSPEPTETAFADELGAAMAVDVRAPVVTTRPGATPELSDALRDVFAQAAEETGLDMELLLAVAWTESGFDQNAVSHAGAIGMMQLMPGTAEGLGVNPFDLVENIRGGARYLAEQLAEFGSVELALAAYNAGPARVHSAGGIPAIAETQAYVPRVLARLAQLQSTADAGAAPSAFPQATPVAPVEPAPVPPSVPTTPTTPTAPAAEAAQPAAPEPPVSPGPDSAPAPAPSAPAVPTDVAATQPVVDSDADAEAASSETPEPSAAAPAAGVAVNAETSGQDAQTSDGEEAALSMPRPPTSTSPRDASTIRDAGVEPAPVANEGLQHSGVPQVSATTTRANPVTVETQPVSFSQLSNMIAARASSGEQMLLVHLDPPELGRVTLRLVTRGDEVMVSINATQSDAVPSLQELRGDVDQALRDRGFELGGFDVHDQRDGDDENPLPEAAGAAVEAVEPVIEDGALRV